MTLGEIYDFVIRQGIATDIRTAKEVRTKLQDTKRKYRKLSKIEKSLFDLDSLKNPYSDSRILCGNRATVVRRILVGIDMEVGEVLLADRLSSKGKKIDLILAHHPEGKALAALDDVMDLQVSLLVRLGFSEKIAKDLMENRMKEVARRLHGANHTRSVDAAKILDIAMMCCHTPSDNHVSSYLQKMMDSKKPKTLRAIIDLLLREPEYQDAVRQNAGPRILLGKPNDHPGKVVVDMTGGTEGSKEIFARLSQAGVGTLLCMHLSEEHFNKIKPEHINVIIAGHMASDNLGLNLLLDKLIKRDQPDIIECSGFRRVRRA